MSFTICMESKGMMRVSCFLDGCRRWGILPLWR